MRAPRFRGQYVRSKCTFLSIIRFSFTCTKWFIVFSSFCLVCLCKFRCLFLSISFHASLAFLCCFIFIRTFVSFYSFIFSHVLVYFIYHSFSVQWVTAFWSALSAVLFSSLLVSLFTLFAVCFVAVVSSRNNVSVLHSPSSFGLLFLYCNFLLFTVLLSTHAFSAHFVTLNFRSLSSWFCGVAGQLS